VDNSDVEFKHLVQKIQKGRVIHQMDANGNRYPRFDFLKDHFRGGGAHEAVEGNWVVQNVILRSKRVYNLTDPGDLQDPVETLLDTGYRMEINVDRKWVGHNSKGEPAATYCGVSVYHLYWAGLLDEIPSVGAEHTWDRDLTDFFPEGFRDFHAKMQDISRLLDEAANA